MNKLKLITVMLAVAALVQTGDACTVVIAGKKATADGSVLNSHTDCGPDCRIQVVPGRKYPEGTMAPVYYGILTRNQPEKGEGEILGYIPQAEETYTYFHSAYSHINEYQLCIGESTMSQRPELQVDKGEGKQIMTVEQAAVFALQRCKTAEEALALITSLMEEYGFLPSCGPESECLTLADPDKVWVLELFSVGKGWTPESGKPGVIWAAQRLPDDQVAIIPNWSIIKEIDLGKPDQFKASSNYMQEAVDRGWYDPSGQTSLCVAGSVCPDTARMVDKPFLVVQRDVCSRNDRDFTPYERPVQEPRSVYTICGTAQHLSVLNRSGKEVDGTGCHGFPTFHL